MQIDALSRCGQLPTSRRRVGRNLLAQKRAPHRGTRSNPVTGLEPRGVASAQASPEFHAALEHEARNDAPLAETAKKLGVNFFASVFDRVSQSYHLPSLAQLIHERVALPST